MTEEMKAAVMELLKEKLSVRVSRDAYKQTITVHLDLDGEEISSDYLYISSLID